MDIMKLYNGGQYILSDVVDGKLVERPIMFNKLRSRAGNTIEKEIELFKEHIKNLKRKGKRKWKKKIK